MSHLLKLIILASFILSSSAQANNASQFCDESFSNCGLVLVPAAIPDLTVLECGNPISTTSELTNYSTSAVTVSSITLVPNGDNVVTDGVVRGGGPSSCEPGINLAGNGPGPGTQCTVYLDFSPCSVGLLDYDLTITPLSIQRPLVWHITTTVGIGYHDAYVLNSGNNTLLLCPLNEDGSFGNGINPSNGCSPIDVVDSGDINLLNSPWNIVLNPAGDHAYISNTTGNSIAICPVNGDYSLGTCSSATGFSDPRGMAFNNDGSLLYVSNKDTNQVTFCVVNGDASLGSCTSTTTVGSAPSGLLFIEHGNVLLVTDAVTPGQVLFYTVDGSGNLTYNSNRTGVALSEPVAISNGPNHAYVSNSPFDTIGVCDQDTCTQDTVNSLLNLPAGLEMTAINAYISNMGQYGDLSYAITFCPMNSDGTINDAGCSQLKDSSFNGPTDVLLLQ